jgi:hypothetical protein
MPRSAGVFQLRLLDRLESDSTYKLLFDYGLCPMRGIDKCQLVFCWT